MKNYPLEKYRFYQNGNKIIAVSTYEKKTVRGVAICHPDDTFDIELGKRLAAARCNEKVAAKRYARSVKCLAKAANNYNEATNYLNDMRAYRNDSFIALNEAAQLVDSLVKQIKDCN